ncbi:MAG TPA: outer membrane beta-barrel protein [Burkholderiales bacterium]|nr:outer membrane beta-barrel protein [Burkholderiales bacterium]
MRKSLAAIFTVSALAAADATAQETLRAGKAELSLSPLFTAAKNSNFPNGASAKSDSATGFGIQWAYNFDDHWSAGIEGAVSGVDYAGNAAPAVGNNNPAIAFNAHAETTTLRMAMTYNIITAQFTPFVTVGAGLTRIDTNVPNGAVPGCFWYPYWGQVCNDVPARILTEFSYSAAVGVRYDLRSQPVFFRAAYNREWINFGGSTGSLPYDQLRVDLGVRY